MLQKLLFCVLLAAAMPVGPAALGDEGMIAPAPTSLVCEHLTNPLGIDAPHPRLGWILPWQDRGARQTAYQIRVGSSMDSVRHKADLWDSGKVVSAQSFDVPYAGRPLVSGAACWWSVRAWNGKGEPSQWSAPSRWQMGLLSAADWKAKWIAMPGDTGTHGPLPIFRHEFYLSSPVRSATLSICGLGQFEVHINGRRIGDHFLDPGWSNYRKRCLYVTFDVTQDVRAGHNAIGLLLGNGMYNVPGQRYVKFVGSYGPPKAIAQINIELQSGEHLCVYTNSHWMVSPGPIMLSSIYGNEDYDARREQPGWDLPGFRKGSSWCDAAEVEGPGGVLRAQMIEPIRILRTLEPAARPAEAADGGYLYDFGENFSARPCITCSGKAGTVIKLLYGERLTGGRVDQGDTGWGYFSYTLRGTGVETWSPQFSYTGYRYIEVYGARPSDKSTLPSPIGTEADREGPRAILHAIVSQVVAADVSRDGDFSCSVPLLNATRKLINHAVISNTQSIMTDCPTREKLGWLEQVYLMGPSVMYDFGVQNLYSKMCADIRDSQTADGLTPDIAPEFTVFPSGFRDSPEWGSACIQTPWLVYRRYGDIDILRDNYACMQRYLSYLGRRAPNGILAYGLGDWYDIGPGAPGESKNTPRGVTATAIYYADAVVLARIATILGHDTDSREYADLAAQIRDAFNKAYYNPQTHQYATGSQCANAEALAQGLTDHRGLQQNPSHFPAGDQEGAFVLHNLIADIAAHGMHTTAGDIGYGYVLRALANAGRSDIVFAMATRTDSPSYGYQLAHGATSLTEAWDGPTSGNSQNHFMLGKIEEWFYHDLAGIQVDFSQPAGKTIVIAPHFVRGVDWVSASYRCVWGVIRSRWTRHRNKITLDVVIPANASAEIRLPGKAAVDVPAGAWQFKFTVGS